MRHGIGRLRAGGSSGDADANAWAAAVTANGGTYSAATLAAVTAFTVSAKASGYWTKLNRINLFCGNQLAAALVPLKVGGGNATETNTNFVSGDYSEATGLTGDGTGKSLNTGLVASSLPTDSTHLSVYNRSSVATSGSGGHIGATSASGRLSMYAPFTTAAAFSYQYGAGSGEVSSAALATPFGNIVATRTSSASHTIYRNGSSVASSATSGLVLPAEPVFVFAWNGGGSVATQFTAHTLAAYSIGFGLSAADVTAYNTHMQTFQASLSRNV